MVNPTSPNLSTALTNEAVQGLNSALTNAEQEEKALQVQLKALEVQEKHYQLSTGIALSARESECRLTLDKLLCLESMLTSRIIDESKSIIGSECTYKQAFSEEECWIIKAKMIELIQKL
ncbi:MAG: hypothetical protein ACK500_05995 [Flavobacteriales bacterium]|jgi:hypothetical protein